MKISGQKRLLEGSRNVTFVVALITVFGLSCNRQRESGGPPGQAAATPNVAQQISQIDELYKQREDLLKVRQGIAMLRQARIADYGNFDLAWRLSKFDYYLGTHTTDDRERDEAFREGIEVGKYAVQVHDDRPEGHLWLGANYGGDAQNSTLAGLANVEDIRKEMEAVLKLNEGFEGAAAYVGLGQLYLDAPRALGGDTQKAIEVLQKGLSIAPDNAVIRLNLAKAYHSTKKDAEARQQIEYILKMTPNPNYLPEYKDTVEKTKKLSDEIGKG